METLPEPILLEILTRLTDSSQLARCRLISRTFNSLISSQIRKINLTCTLSRYLKSRSLASEDRITPFKTVVNRLIANSLVPLESVVIGVEESLLEIEFDDVKEEEELSYDDLYMCDVRFVKEWLVLPRVCRELKFLSVCDFWIQACWRKSQILALISHCCSKLLELELKNAWLSVDGLNPMPMLTRLTLETIRLDDENLSKVNECFPCLQVLNLIGVGGLKEPIIRLCHLRTCRWTVSNAPNSVSIFAPSLVQLELNCIEPESLVLETPLLYDFYLSIQKTNKIEVNQLVDLKVLHLESASMSNLIHSFPSNNSVENLSVDSLNSVPTPDESARLSLEMLFDVFPKVSSLSLLSGAWSEMEASFLFDGATSSFIFAILEKCANLSDFGLLIHCEADSNIASGLVSQCKDAHPAIRWRWGMWKKGSKNRWIPNT